MQRRAYLLATGTALCGPVAGCVAPGSDDDGVRDDDTGGDDADGSAAAGSEFVRDPEGDAEITVRLDLTPGFGEPETFTVELELDRVEVSRPDEDPGAEYGIERTVELLNEPTDDVLTSDYKLTDPSGDGDEDEFGYTPGTTLVDEAEIAVGTYDYLRIHGSVRSVELPDGEDVALPEAGALEWTLGSVFESGDHREHTLTVAVSEGDDGYELTSSGMSTVSW